MKNYHAHYGILLDIEIKDKGYKLDAIAKKLHISVLTLNSRIKDGNFRFNQIDVLIENRYLPKK